MAWLASAVAVAQEGGGPSPGEKGADAAKPIVPTVPIAGGQSEVAPPTDTSAEAAAAEKRDQELRAELQQLRAQTEELKASLEATAAELGAERDQRAEEVIGLQEKAEKEHEKAAKSVRVSGYLQADWTTWRQSSEDQINQSTGDPINEERFMIRRARLRASLDRDYVAGLVEFDGNTTKGTTARLIGAEASVKLPGEQPDLPLAMITVGLFKIPFGFEVVQSDRERLFLERSVAEHGLFPGEYDLGARLAGGWRFVRYAIAVQNGEPLGERTWPGRDPNAAKDVTGRLGVDTPITDIVSIAGGFSGLKGTGFHSGSPATKPTLQWVDRNENSVVDPGEITATPGVAATPSLNFPRFGYGADLRVNVAIPQIGSTTVYGEVYFAKNLDRGILPADPRGPLGRDLREFGGYAALTQEIGPHFAVGVRYDYYNPDQDSTNLEMGMQVPTSFAYQTISGVVAYMLPLGRFSLEYDHNGNKLGRDASGNPVNLKDDSVILRGQVAF
jgi:hypothetical protein